MRLSAFVFAALLGAGPALAAPEISVDDGYATAPGALAMAGAAYFTIHNSGTEGDRLIGVESPVAKRVMLHASVADGAVMRMVPLDEGIAVPAGGVRRLESGGDHVMLMGLTVPLAPGDMVALTLVFETAGRIAVELPVTPGRAP